MPTSVCACAQRLLALGLAQLGRDGGLQRVDAREQPGPRARPQRGDRGLRARPLPASRAMVGGYRVRRGRQSPQWRPTGSSALHALSILDTPPEERFDRLTRIAAAVFDAPISTVTLIDEDRQWHKACIGVERARGRPRRVVLLGGDRDAASRWSSPTRARTRASRSNPLVTGPPYIRFYAGQPITTVDGFRVGTLCVIDTRPREFGAGRDRAAAGPGADRRGRAQPQGALARRSRPGARASSASARCSTRPRSGSCWSTATGHFVEVNAAFAAMLGIPADELRGVRPPRGHAPGRPRRRPGDVRAPARRRAARCGARSATCARTAPSCGRR